MKPFNILITSAFILSSVATHAESSFIHDAIPSSQSLYAPDAEPVSVEEWSDSLSFLEDEVDEFEEEISALEEELKDDEEFAAAPTAEVIEPIFVVKESDLNTDAGIDEPEAVYTAPVLPMEFAAVEPELTIEDPILESIISEEPILLESPIEQAQLASLGQETAATYDLDAEKPELLSKDVIEVNLKQAFAGSPYIYTLLGIMSATALSIWLYSMLTLRKSLNVPQSFLKNLENKLNSNQFEEALTLCSEKRHLLSKMISSGIANRRHGLPVMVEAMKAEGKRASIQSWQRIGLLNDIAILAPMLGLLGTVLGMFYAFYDINRSIESITTLFDGLGVSVGTTVAGLAVAILALILHSTVKFRLVKTLATVENEAQTFANLIDDRTSVSKS